MIQLEAKDYIAIVLMILAIPAFVTLSCLSTRARDVLFFLVITTAVIPDLLDVNFISRYYYYRGPTRGFEICLVDLLAFSLLISSIIKPREGQNRFYFPASFGLLVIFLGYCLFSVTIAQFKIVAAFEFTKFVRAVLVFLAAAFYVRGEKELRVMVTALACVVFIEGVLSVKQRYLDGIHRVEGSVGHPNSLSMYLCMVTPVLMAAGLSNIPKWLQYFCFSAIAVAAVTIVLTISRAGIPMFLLVTCGAAIFAMTWKITIRKVVVGVACMVAFVGLMALSWDNIMSRYNEASMAEEYLKKGNEGRGIYLRLARHILNDHFLGVGINNWSYAVSKTYGAREGMNYRNYDPLNVGSEPPQVDSMQFAAPAHNLAALTAGELGIPGLILFALCWMRWFQMGQVFLWKKSTELTHQIGIGLLFAAGGVFLQSLTEWTYRQTPIILTFHLLLGALASMYWVRKQKKREAREAVLNESPVAALLSAPEEETAKV